MASIDRLASRFRVKLACAALLVALADVLFFRESMIGSTLGGFALALLVAATLTQPAMRRDARARLALPLAAVFALMLVDAPTALRWALFWTSLAVAALSPRVKRGEDAWPWFLRILFQSLAGLIGPARDLLRRKGRVGRRSRNWLARLAILPLPIAGGAIFLALFASANPILGSALAHIQWPAWDPWRPTFWVFILLLIWMIFRPQRLRLQPKSARRRSESPWPPRANASIGLSLVVFNAIFAVENGIDIAFLWSGARLPAGVTFTDYVHQGAFTLIATALLAGLFVLVALAPQSTTSRQPWIRRLVVLWVAQNILLVGSSMLRTLKYIEVFELTSLRIAALIWMALVAVGLALICWRMLRARSGAWLINANVAAAAVVLIACCPFDFNAIAAEWNVDHARELGGGGQPLDTCYLNQMGEPGLVALAELEQRPLAPAFRDRVSRIRAQAFRLLSERQSDWRGWTWRGARRLERTRALGVQPGVTGAIACGGD